jgi:hypothetical protein
MLCFVMSHYVTPHLFNEIFNEVINRNTRSWLFVDYIAITAAIPEK